MTDSDPLTQIRPGLGGTKNALERAQRFVAGGTTDIAQLRADVERLLAIAEAAQTVIDTDDNGLSDEWPYEEPAFYFGFHIAAERLREALAALDNLQE